MRSMFSKMSAAALGVALSVGWSFALVANAHAAASPAGAGAAHGSTQLTIRIDARAAAVIRAVSAGATLQQALAQLPAPDSAQRFKQDCAGNGGHAKLDATQRLCV